jgi:hypothetical protein
MPRKALITWGFLLERDLLPAAVVLPVVLDRQGDLDPLRAYPGRSGRDPGLGLEDVGS